MALMGIGEFARLSRISPKALRRYDELGLLPPSRVDPWTGYRWYSADQLDRARLVATLRQVGVPAPRIREIIGLEAADAAAAIDAYWSGAEAEHATRRELAGYLVDRLNGKRSPMHDVIIRDVPARTLLSLLRYVHAGEFPEVAREFSARFADDKARLARCDTMFFVYHGEVSEDSDGPVEFCRPVPDDLAAEMAARFPDLSLRTEPAHQEAFIRLERDPAQTPAGQSMIVLDSLLAWAAAQRRRPSGSVRQVIVRRTAGYGLECDFTIPLAGREQAADAESGAQAPGPWAAGDVLASMMPRGTVPVTSGMAPADGADLYYERRGDGPPLLMITGGGGDAAYYSAIADILAARHTVVTYDRRGNSRSAPRGEPVPVTMPQQSADAVTVLRACGFESAAVFGNSGGATIALDLAAGSPGAVTTVVAHEPPVPRVLPDADAYLAIYDEIGRVLLADGWRAAFGLFQVKVGGLPPDRPDLLAPMLNPEGVIPPGPMLDAMLRVSRNWEYMMRHEVRPFVDYLPDAGRIAEGGARVVIAAGTDSGDRVARRICEAVAAMLGTSCAEFPGGHTAPMDSPQAFATRLLAVLSSPS